MKALVYLDDVLNLFGIEDEDLYAKGTIEDSVYNGSLPLVDYKDKRGQWVKIGGYVTPGGDPVWRCSKCGKGIHVYGIEHGTYGEDVAEHQWVACPNCGCVMDGEK